MRLHDLVLGAPVRLMGQAVLLGTWSMAGSQDVAPELVKAFHDMNGGVERLRWPERVIAAMAAAQARGGRAAADLDRWAPNFRPLR